jgi:hypothetical protein
MKRGDENGVMAALAKSEISQRRLASAWLAAAKMQQRIEKRK